ncbi:unnamed protein product [Fusarium venenatum]|uniref:Uncharacterized protein n=1 Tax=Fusarium venenatum TaxID=56646 RepID=A0A2L2TFK1_9HYPO|nr:uncharacterized protein FVRRES_03325 [Fusarium venenatum]CEI66813.1 unnamed protein product [Fusarium venenatum]
MNESESSRAILHLGALYNTPTILTDFHRGEHTGVVSLVSPSIRSLLLAFLAFTCVTITQFYGRLYVQCKTSGSARTGEQQLSQEPRKKERKTGSSVNYLVCGGFVASLVRPEPSN